MAVKDFIKEHWYDHEPSRKWYDLIMKYAQGRKKGLDIGTSSGFSACAMALMGVSVVSIDVKIKDISKRVSKELKVDKKIDFYKMTSDEWFDYQDIGYDIIVIDGNHDYDFVKRDLDNSWKCLNEGGVIICDDFNHYNGTRRAILDWSKENNIKFVEEEERAIFTK